MVTEDIVLRRGAQYIGHGVMLGLASVFVPDDGGDAVLVGRFTAGYQGARASYVLAPGDEQEVAPGVRIRVADFMVSPHGDQSAAAIVLETAAGES